MADSQSVARLPARTQESLGAPALISFEQMEKMADAFAKSNLFGVKTKDAALALLMIAQAEGIHPALAVMEYDIIEGKPARKAERILARFQASGGRVEWLTYTDDAVKARFTHPHGADVEIEWTSAHAAKIKFFKRAAGNDQGGWYPLTDKYNWKNYRRAMLRSRCISEGVRACYPGTGLVLLSTEEATDYGTIESEPVSEEAEAPPAATKSAHALRKEQVWPPIIKALRLVETKAEFEAWEDAHADTINSFPQSWRDELNEEIEKHREHIAEQKRLAREARAHV